MNTSTPRIPPVDDHTAPPEAGPLLAAVQARLGRVPRMVATMAHAPALLRGYLGLSQALGAGLLTPREREIAALAIAEVNGCHYCLATHERFARRLGLTGDDIAAARLGRARTPREHAVASLAAALVRQHGRITDDAWSEARAAGLDDARVLELVGHVGMNVLTNYLNHVARTEPDPPAA
jgi:uncharacterized peroxidase-related enzyme